MRALTTEKKKKKKKKKKTSESTEKPLLKIFDGHDSLLPNYRSFGFLDNNQMDGSFAQNSYILSRLLMESFWLNFVETY